MAGGGFILDPSDKDMDYTVGEEFSEDDDDDDDDDSSESSDFMGDNEAEHETPDNDFRLYGFDDLGFCNDGEEGDAGDLIITPSAGHKRKRASLRSTSTTTPCQQRDINTAKVDADEGFILEDDNSRLPTKSGRVLGTFGRQNRLKGECLPAYHKRVSAILDKDDQLMMDMREQGFSDRAIAEKLAKIGGIRYDQKSIGTRIMRIRLAQAANVDFLLDEGYKEWEIEDDNNLMKAFAIADIETNYEIERVRAWRFRKVSEYMRRFNKDSLFSVNACRERYKTLAEGAATLPTEQDDEPDLRRAEREAFCFAREEFRNQEKAEKDAKEAIESRAREEAKVVRAEKAVEIANRNAAKQNETAQKLMKRAAQAQIRAQLATANQNAKTQRNTQIKKQRADAVAELNKAEARLNKPESKPAGDKAAATTLPNLKDVTKHTPDPRAYLSLHDLTTMCAERGFDTTLKAKADLIQQLRDTDDEWSKEDLAKMCRAKTLSSNGTKAQLKYRMALAAAKDYPSFMPGLAAAKVDEDMDVDME